ncbi:hypothetical protein IWQ62_003364 [Dispira parvispora]|uniref:Ubiquitin-like domain-containing protein n=1 Tax=Dispira parvispora TaxID=1520584 RepID=A0A9W8AUZ0_9FUNG|nr:hypothetical protein IWQ62_003364 [Dispira parvispora]
MGICFSGPQEGDVDNPNRLAQRDPTSSRRRRTHRHNPLHNSTSASAQAAVDQGPLIPAILGVPDHSLSHDRRRASGFRLGLGGSFPRGGGNTSALLTQSGNRPLVSNRHYAWKSTNPQLTRSILERERLAFWDTAPTYGGRAEIWQALKLAIEADTRALAQAIVDSVQISIPTGRLTDGCFDELGNYYLVPIYCLQDPTNLVEVVDNNGRNGQSGGAPSTSPVSDERTLHHLGESLPSQSLLSSGKMSSPELDVGGLATSVVTAHSFNHDPPVSESNLGSAGASLYEERTSVRSIEGKSAPSVGSPTHPPPPQASFSTQTAGMPLCVRLSSNGKDIKLNVTKSDTLQQVKLHICQSEHLVPDDTQVRFFLLGKQLDYSTIPFHDPTIKSAKLIQALVSTRV